MLHTPHLSLKLKEKKFFFRPIIPSDKLFVKFGFRELSSKSRYLRFFAHQNELSDQQLKFFTELDNENHVAWGVVDVSDYGIKPAAVGRFIRMKEDPQMAEVAITVVDNFQRMGLGRTLIAILNIVGYKMGIRTFRYHVLPENIGILENINPYSERRKTADRSVLMLDAALIPSSSSLKETKKTKKFIEVMRRVESKLNL